MATQALALHGKTTKDDRNDATPNDRRLRTPFNFQSSQVYTHTKITYLGVQTRTDRLFCLEQPDGGVSSLVPEGLYPNPIYSTSSNFDLDSDAVTGFGTPPTGVLTTERLDKEEDLYGYDTTSCLDSFPRACRRGVYDENDIAFVLYEVSNCTAYQ